MAVDLYTLGEVHQALGIEYRQAIGLVQMLRHSDLSVVRPHERRLYTKRELFELAVVKTLAYDLTIGPLAAFSLFRRTEGDLPLDDVMHDGRDAIVVIPTIRQGVKIVVYDGPSRELAEDVFSRTSCLLLRLRDILTRTMHRLAKDDTAAEHDVNGLVIDGVEYTLEANKGATLDDIVRQLRAQGLDAFAGEDGNLGWRPRKQTEVSLVMEEDATE